MVLLLLACGPEDDNPTTPPTSATTATPVATYDIVDKDDGTFEAVHPENEMSVVFDQSGATVSAVAVELTLPSVELSRYVAAELGPEEDPPDNPYTLVAAQQQPPEFTDRLTYAGDITSWYDHDELGLSVGFEIAAKPAGDGELVLFQPMTTGERGVVTFERPGSVLFRYGKDAVQLTDVLVRDSTGASLPHEVNLFCRSRLDCGALIVIRDDDAVYPLSTSAVVNPPPRIECDAGMAGDDGDAVSSLSAGDLLVTEIMHNPNAVGDEQGEWFEIYNNSGADVNLMDLVIWDESVDEHTVSDCFKLEDGEYAVLATRQNSSINGGVPVDIQYPRGNFQLANSRTNGDEVRIGYKLDLADDCPADECELIDTVEYDNDVGNPWPHNIASVSSNAFNPIGAAFSLDPDFLDDTDNDDADSWCDARQHYGPNAGGMGTPGDFGTPGTANDHCDFRLYFDYSWEDEEEEIIASECTFVDLDGTNGHTTGNTGEGDYVRYTHNTTGQNLEWTYEVNDPDPVTWRSTKAYGTSDFATGAALSIPSASAAEAGTWTENTDDCL